MKKRHNIRTCIGCGRKAEKGTLVRFAVDAANNLVPDIQSLIAGRGIYACMSKQCVERLLRSKRLSVLMKQDCVAGDLASVAAVLGNKIICSGSN